MSETIYKDEGLILDGVFVTLQRSRRDGMILIEIDTAELEGDDVFEGNVPKLRLAVNDSVEETTPDGGWRSVE